MNIEIERNRSISKLIHTILRVKTACHADFIDILTKCADVGYDIYITSLLIGFSIIDIGKLLVNFLELRFKLGLLFFDRSFIFI